MIVPTTGLLGRDLMVIGGMCCGYFLGKEGAKWVIAEERQVMSR